MSSSTSSSSRALPAGSDALGEGRGKPLVTFAVGFILSLAIVLAASEAMLRAVVVPEDSFRAHAALFASTMLSDAAFGDSHTARDFVPPPGMVNLAFPSEGIEHMDWKVRQYFSKRRPGRVVIQADPHLFAPYRLVNRLGDYALHLNRAGIDSRWTYLSDPRFRPQLIALWRAFLRSGGDLSSQVRRTDSGALLSPGNLAEKTPRARTYAARARVRTHSQIAGSQTEAQRAVFSAMLDFLAARGAEICLVSYPLSPDYRTAFVRSAGAAARRERARTLHFFAAEAARSGANYVDQSHAIQDRSAFRDVDHLNGESAPAYSRRLMQACFGGRTG